MSRRRWWGGALPLVLGALAVIPAAAGAAAVPGATYTGTASDGATVTLTISSNGTTVSSYRVVGIFGTDTNYQQCQDTTSVGPSGWAGVPISNGGFQDSVNTEFSFTGAFGGPQSASGTFDLEQAPQGGSAGCSTGGKIAWSATTSSTSPPDVSGNPGDSGGTNGKKPVGVRVSLHRLKHQELGGSLKSSIAVCTDRRMVYLWAGHRRLSSARATRKGAFSFRAHKAWRGRRVHATVREMGIKTGTCQAGSSITIGG